VNLAFAAVVAAALMNAGRTAAVFTLSGTNADMGSRGTKSRPSFTHPAITYVRSMHSLFTGGVEGFPAKVRSCFQRQLPVCCVRFLVAAFPGEIEHLQGHGHEILWRSGRVEL
jgi:hypothetical protein